jgi:AcrR family transcriptional regulator
MDLPACPNSPKIDPRVKRTRKLLEDALRALLCEQPFSEISVSDITERATVNRATFYAHFEDKGHLAATMMSEDLHDAVIERLKPPVAFNLESLTEVAAAMFEFMARTLGGCRKHSDEFSTTVGITLQETLQKFLMKWLELDPQAMRFYRGSNKEAVSTVLAWGIYGGAIRWSKETRRPEATEAAREIVALLLREPVAALAA